LFHRHSDCCDTCDSGGGGHHWGSGGHGSGDTGCCDTCDSGCGHKLFGRLRGLFNRHGGCEADCCNTSCCGTSAYGAPVMKVPEQIQAKPGEAKPMPSTGGAGEKKSELNPAPRLVPAPRPSLTVESANPF
jgi:hypothetical protein